jgi:hypothetical protein
MSFFGFRESRGGEDDKLAQQPRIELEAFQTKLRNKKILLVGPFNNKFPPILESIQDIREPFKKTVLLTSGDMSVAMFPEILLAYDVTFRISKDIDWSLALTYISHVINLGGGGGGGGSSASILVVCEGLNIPDGFFKQINGKPVTFINLSKNISGRSLIYYDACFFPYLDDVTSNIVITWHTILSTLDNVITQKNPSGLRDILTEIRIAGAGLCWIGGRQNGNLYWYDPIQSWTEGFFELTKSQISLILKWITTH